MEPQCTGLCHTRREYMTSARLNLQSLLWKESLGYIIHPSIPTLSPRARVADIGCGTGAWLTQLSDQAGLDPSIQLHGFDIDLSQAPVAQWLPRNIKLYEMNILEDVPSGLRGVYDLVHIRLFKTHITDGDPSTLIRNARSLLKPGGWLQWEENANVGISVVQTSDSQPSSATKELRRIVENMSRTHRERDNWLTRLPEILEPQFDQISVIPHSDPPRLRRYFHEIWLWTLEEYFTTILRHSTQAQKNMQLLSKSYEESGNGTAVQIDKLVCIARKA